MRHAGKTGIFRYASAAGLMLLLALTLMMAVYARDGAEETEAVKSAVEPEEAEVARSAVEPDEADAARSAVEPEEAEAARSAVEPDEREAAGTVTETESEISLGDTFSGLYEVLLAVSESEAGKLLPEDLVEELQSLDPEELAEYVDLAVNVYKSPDFQELMAYDEVRDLAVTLIQNGLDLASDEPKLADMVLQTLGVDRRIIGVFFYLLEAGKERPEIVEEVGKLVHSEEAKQLMSLLIEQYQYYRSFNDAQQETNEQAEETSSEETPSEGTSSEETPSEGKQYQKMQ